MKLISELDKVCVAKAREAGQGHIFDSWESLSPEEQQSLLEQVESIEFPLFRRLIQEHILSVAGPLENRALKPAPLTVLPSPERDLEDYRFCKNLGEYALRMGEVLIVTAGGGGGVGPFSEPVGKLPVSPVSDKSVFQLLAERILALGKRHRVSLRWNLFCHPAELELVKEFFKAHSFFGLKRSSVTFTPQRMLPVVDRRGKILLAEKGRLATCPSGHGSILLHFLDESHLKLLEEWGIRHIFYHQVDNPLVPIVDSVFLGMHIRNRSEVSSKAVRKKTPDESVGVFCQYNESIGVVEYVELDEEDREARLSDGTLAFSAANIGVHVFNVEFIQRMRSEGLHLPFHAIQRYTPCLNRRGEKVQPVETNSIGFKAFVFDAIPLARRAMVTEVERKDEFSPIKGPAGPSSPETAKRDLSCMYARWLQGAGHEVEGALGQEPERRVEVSPLFALDVEELKSKKIPEIPPSGDVLLGDGP